jgi:hypothetical protein
MTVDEMLDRMSSAELSQWKNVFEIRDEEAERQKRMADKGMRSR